MPERLAKRLLLIGWDAADWQMIQPLMDRGEMPVLKKFLEMGVRSNIATLNPILSPILWNSIATGKRADKHDILGFIEPDGKGHVRPVSSTSRKAKAFWNILSQNGLRSTIVNWFASYPAERINGRIVTNRYEMSVEDREQVCPLDERALHPWDMAEVLTQLRVKRADISGEQAQMFISRLDEVVEKAPIFAEALTAVLSECATVHNAATYLIEENDWDVMAVYYPTIDHFGHAFMEFHPPKMAHVTDLEFEILREVMDNAYRFHDLMLARYLDLIGPETTVMILSDHGFHSGNMRPRLFVDPVTGKKHGAGKDPVAWHRSHGVFAMAGPGVKKNQEIFGTSLLDICPTILAMMGLPVGDDMDGRVLTQAFERTPEIGRVATHEGEMPHDGVHRGEQQDDPYSAQEVLKQLAELGYIETPTDDHEALVRSAIRDRKGSLAQVLHSAGRLSEAESLLRELLAEHGSHGFRTRLAMCLVAQERFSEAEKLIDEEALDVTQRPVVTLLLAQVKHGKGEYAEAERLMEEVIGFGVRFQRLHTQLGRVRIKLGKWDGAEAALLSAIAEDGDDAEAHDALGTVYRQLGRHEEAIYEHMKSIALHHDNAAAHVNLGIALADAKQLEWAIRAFETAADLAPEWPYPHRCLYQLYKRGKRDMARAREHMTRALALRGAAQLREIQRAEGRGSWT